MNNIRIFEKEGFGTIRVSMSENNEPLFCGKDLASVLGYSNTSVAISTHCKTGIDVFCEHANGMGGTNLRYVKESDVYRLIMHSNLPSAEKFQDWVCEEVLPSIRKDGIYATDNTIDMILNNPDFGIELLTKLKEERANRIEAEKRVAILTHVNKTYTVTEIAKELNMKSAQELNQRLADKKIQYNINGSWVMYSDYSNRAFEELKQEVLDNGKVIYHRRITQLGREFIINLFAK